MRRDVQAVLRNLPDHLVSSVDVESLGRELDQTRETIKPVDQPRIYQIETTSRCNLACTFCPRTTSLVPGGQRDLDATMPLSEFCRILDQLPWLRSIELFHFGEPFMHRDLHRYIQACADRGIETTVASNLLPATDLKIDKAFEAGLTFLVMDVDSLDPDRYASMRVNGSLERLRDRVRYVLGHERRPFTVAQTINVDGVREYDFRAFRSWVGEDVPMPDEIRYKFLDSFRGEIADKGELGPEDVCREPFYGFTVHVNGNVVPCDRDWAGENVMGNLFTQTVDEIWNGERFREFRRKMKSDEKPAMCRRCPEGRLVNARSQPLVQVNQFRGEEVFHR